MFAVPLRLGAPAGSELLAFNPLDYIPSKEYIGGAAGTIVDTLTGIPRTVVSGAARGRRILGQWGSAVFNTVFCSATKALRVTASANHGLGFGTVASFGMNEGIAESSIELLDMNGDLYPDAVTSRGILFNTGSGFESSMTVIPLPDGEVRNVRNIRHKSGHIGTLADKLMNVVDGQGNSVGFTGAGAGLSYGKSMTDADLVDINGDGLPDRVEADTSTGNINVHLNFGRRFGARMVWPGARWDNGAQESTALPQLFQAFGLAIDPNALRVEETATNNGGLSTTGAASGWRASFGAGASNTLVRQLVSMVDINGDHLPDQVMKSPGADVINVKVNLGDRFATEQLIPVAAWPPGIGEPPGGLSGVGLGPADALGFTIGSGSHWNGSVSVPLGSSGLVTNISHSSSGSDMWESLGFEDIDGDGKVDHVIKTDGNATVFARLNQTGKTNLLRRVIGPIGGTIDLDYQRIGNIAKPDTRQDMPGNQWALASITVSDGRDPLGLVGVYTDTISYDAVGQPGVSSAFYDRVERESYGYAHLVITHGEPTGVGQGIREGDGTRVERFYSVADYYRKGLLLAEFEEDFGGNPFRGASFRYAGPPTPPPARTGSFFPKEIDRYHLFYEGVPRNVANEVDFATASPLKFKQETRAFDVEGNLLFLIDNGDEQTTADDIHYKIEYLRETNTHITRANLVVGRGAGQWPGAAQADRHLRRRQRERANGHQLRHRWLRSADRSGPQPGPVDVHIHSRSLRQPATDDGSEELCPAVHVRPDRADLPNARRRPVVHLGFDGGLRPALRPSEKDHRRQWSGPKLRIRPVRQTISRLRAG